MASVFTFEVGPGANRTRRRWDRESPIGVMERRGGGGRSVGEAVGGREERPIVEFTQKSRNNMRFQFNNMQWAMCGPDLSLVTLTWPREWRAVTPDARVMAQQRDNFRRRLEREFGPVRGVWVVEFQRRGAPHLHIYMALPEGVRDELVRVRADSDYRKMCKDRGKCKRTGGRCYGHDVLTWPQARLAWFKTLKSGDLDHAEWGLNVTPAWAEGVDIARYANRVGDYFWRESGKKGYQKVAPEGFGGLHYWGKWGIKPYIVEGQFSSERTFHQFRRVQRGWARVKNGGHAVRPPKGHDGMSVFSIDGGIDWTLRVLRLCEDLAEEDHRDRLTDAQHLRLYQRWCDRENRRQAAWFRELTSAEDDRIDALVDAQHGGRSSARLAAQVDVAEREAEAEREAMIDALRAEPGL